MSQLIAMRRRINSIQTVKKITQAMRLIALSTQTRIRSRANLLHSYVHELQQFSERLLTDQQNHAPSVVNPEKYNDQLIILIGSQKGLCGTFNTFLFQFFEQHCLPLTAQTKLIVIGKKVCDYAQKKHLSTSLSFSELNARTVDVITQEITEHIWQKSPYYSSINIIFNHLQRKVVATPHELNLIPFASSQEQYTHKEAYYWAQKPEHILDLTFRTLVSTRLHGCILGSLLAEQMARFTSMHRATKNASDLLESMKISYNKLRQAKITRELTDLVGSL